MKNSLIKRAAQGVRKHMSKAAKLLAVGVAMGASGAKTFALTNDVDTVRSIMTGAENNFDYGFTLGLGVLGVVILMGWLKYGIRGAFGNKKA